MHYQSIALDLSHDHYLPDRRAARYTPPLHALDAGTLERHAVEMAATGERRKFVEWLYQNEQCWICERYLHCSHREPAVDIARAEALARKVGRIQR